MTAVRAPAPEGGKPATSFTTCEFWYDFSSPYAYLGSTQIAGLAQRTGARIAWRPMLLGALFKSVGTPMVPLFEQPKAKQAYLARDVQMWAAHFDVPFHWPSRFPMRTITALRLALAADADIARLSHVLFRAYWAEDQNIDDKQILTEILAGHGFDPALLERTDDPAIKDQLRTNTEAAATAGLFGAPTFVVKDEQGDLQFWGQDRMPLVERALTGWRPQAG